MSIVNYFKLVLEQLDVTTTFFAWLLEETVYMQQLEGFVETEGLICLSKK